MSLFPAVDGLRDGDDYMDEKSINRPINQLRERTDFLKSQLEQVIGAAPFESVRLQNVTLALDDTPVVGDFVYLEPENNTYAKALTDTLIDALNPFTHATNTAFAMGMVTKIVGAGATVIMFGRLDLGSTTLSTLLESGETFRDGPYYLSASEPGKMTAEPAGPAIFLGYFVASVTDPTFGDTALLSPQYKDLWQAHTHYNFALGAQPAGDNEATGTDIVTDITRVRGIKPDDYQPGGANAGTEPPYRLFLLGAWQGQGTPTYTVWIEAADDTMATAKVFWATDDGSDNSFPGFDDPSAGGYDPDYGATVGRRVSSYETPIPIGSKGLSIVLEKEFDSTLAAPDWGSADFDAIVALGLPLIERNWTLPMPHRPRGWLPHWVRQLSVYTGTSGTPPEYTLHLFGGYDNLANRLTERIKVTVTSAGDFATGTVDLEVFDREDASITTFAGVDFSGPGLDLGNGLWLTVSRFKPDHTLATSTTAALTDVWELSFADESPGAKFAYNIDMDPSLSSRWPPSPLSAVVMEVNGVTMDQRDFFAAGAGTYKPASDTFYWYANAYSRGPFPQDWETLISTGLPEHAMNEQLFLTRLAMAGTGLVTSLKAAPGSQLEVVDCNTGEPANVGDLEIRSDFSFSLSDNDLLGANAVKGVGEDGQLLTGRVVEKILAGPGVIVTENDPTHPGQGTVRISSGLEGLLRGKFDEIVLQNAKQELVPNRLFPYVKLLKHDSTLTTNVPTAFIAKFRVPQILIAKYRIIVYATVFGLDDVPTGVNIEDRRYFGLEVTYSVLQDLTDESSPDTFLYVSRNLAEVGPAGVLETTFDIPGDVPLGKLGDGYKAYDPLLLHNDLAIPSVEGQVVGPFAAPFPVGGEDPETVTAGDLVAVRFARISPVGGGHTGAPFEYTGHVGLINLSWKLVEV